MSTRSGKRSAPSDFDDEVELKHQSKMARTGDFVPAFTSAMSASPPAPAQSSSDLLESATDLKGPATRSAKRKLEQHGEAWDPHPSKRLRSSNGRWLLPTCRGGSTRRRRVVVDSDDEGGERGETAPEESPATPTKEPAAETGEKNDEDEPPSSSQKPTDETDGSGSKDGDNSSEPMSSSRKTDGGSDSASLEETLGSSGNSSSNNDSGERTSSSRKTVDGSDSSSIDETITSSGSSSNNNDSGEPTSSSRKSVDGTDSSSFDETVKSSGSSEKFANDSSSTSDSANEQGSEEASKKAAKVDTRLGERQPRQISGLMNNSNQCFSNSVIQFIDAALDGHDVDTVLGPLESVAPFKDVNINSTDSFEPQKKRGARKGGKKPESAMSRVRTAVHNGIDKVRSSGKLQALSPRKHLRALLHRVRQYKSKTQPEKVNGYVFQQILAYGEGDGSREHLDGREQEDCYEYFDALLGGIKYNSGEDPEDEDYEQRPAIISSLFEHKTETASVCSNESCDHKGDSVQEETNSAHTINAPKKPATFEDLLDESNVSQLDQPCPKCGETLARVTEFKELAENFVVHVNRVGPNQRTKIKTAIELPFEPIELGGKKFVLNAIITHRGASVQAGHYTIYRKRSRDWETSVHGNSSWYHIDDEEVSSIGAKNIKDSGRYGQSSMLLFKALETMS